MPKPNAQLAVEIARKMRAGDLCFMTMTWSSFQALGEIERVTQNKMDRVAKELLERHIVIGYGRHSISLSKDRDFLPDGVTWETATAPAVKAAQAEPAPPPPSARKHRQNGQQAADQSSSAART